MDIDPAVKRVFEKWGFQPHEELASGYCSRIFGDESRIAKVPFQGEEMTSGYRAAFLMAERGGPRVFDGDESTGAVLMERIVPGVSLSRIGGPDGDAFDIIRKKVEELEGLPTEGMMPLSEFFSSPDPFQQFMLDNQREEVFLHGDLHHDNVLWGREGWVTIDPKGLRGDRAFEAGAFIRNPVPDIASWPNLSFCLRERIVAWGRALQSEPWRIWGWALANLRDANTEGDECWSVVRRELEAIWPDEVPSELR